MKKTRSLASATLTHTVRQFMAGFDGYIHVKAHLTSPELPCYPCSNLLWQLMWLQDLGVFMCKSVELPAHMVACYLGRKPLLFQRFCFRANLLQRLLQFSWPSGGGSLENPLLAHVCEALRCYSLKDKRLASLCSCKQDMVLERWRFVLPSP